MHLMLTYNIKILLFVTKTKIDFQQTFSLGIIQIIFVDLIYI